MAEKADSGCLGCFIVIGIGLVISVMGVLFALIGWWTLLVIIVFVIILVLIVGLLEDRRKAQEREAQAHLEAQAQAHREAQVRRALLQKCEFYKLKSDDRELYTSKADTEIAKMVKNCVVIDTCVWMSSPDLECFFIELLYQCKLNNSKVTIPAAVYDEVERLKKDRDHKKRVKARIAFERIKLFTEKGALEVPGLQNVADRKAYADKDLISLVDVLSFEHSGDCDYMVFNNSEVYLITNDQELIIRAKNILHKRKLCHFVSVKPTEFSDSPEARDFIQYFKERLQNLANEQSEK